MLCYDGALGAQFGLCGESELLLVGELAISSELLEPGIHERDRQRSQPVSQSIARNGLQRGVDGNKVLQREVRALDGQLRCLQCRVDERLLFGIQVAKNDTGFLRAQDGPCAPLPRRHRIEPPLRAASKKARLDRAILPALRARPES